MNEQIKSRFSAEILAEAVRLYGTSPDGVRLLGDFDSFVYDFAQGGRDYILRISHSSVRSPSLVKGELDWLTHLVAGGASVCGVVPSVSSNLLEEIKDGHGGTFVAAVFHKAEGTSPKRGEWTPERMNQYGKMLGRIHRLSLGYLPSRQEWVRPAWDHPVILNLEGTLSRLGDQKRVLDEFGELISEISAFPKDEDSYGLIHQDAHGANLTIDLSGRIRLFDFFDCAYSWYINDIAIVLFYAAMWEKDRAAFTDVFMSHFLAGYTSECEIETDWLAKIPQFLKLREIDLYAVILREFGENWDTDPWNAGYMEGRKECIEQRIPYIEYDFVRLV